MLEYSGIAKWAGGRRVRGQRNAVFIWIPKVAGTSIHSMLGSAKFKRLRLVKYRFPGKGIVTFGHLDYAKLVREGYVSRAFDESAYKFAFTRNPYDRTVSLYFYLRRKGKYLPAEETFVEFCRRLRDKGIEQIGLYNRKGMSQCNPQIRWVENVKLDFFGRMENLEADAKTALAALGLPANSVPHLNKTSHADCADYYCPESRQIVEGLYREDFEQFGYDLVSP